MKRFHWIFRCHIWLASCLFAAQLMSTGDVLAQWTEFRGPNGSGIADAHDLPTQWSADNIRWRTEIAGRGWSSPVISGDEIWMTTAIETTADEATVKSRLAKATMPGLEVKASARLKALCVSCETGKLVHDVDLFDCADPPLVHPLNSLASPTPVIDGDYVYCSFGTMGTACVQRSTGAVVWRNTELKLNHETGPGSSPIIVGDLLILNCDGIDVQFIVALDKATGKIAWRRDRSGKMQTAGMMRKAFSTPTLVRFPGGPQLLSAAADWLYAYDPQSGAELWRIPYGKLGYSTVPRPVFSDGKVYICTGFNQSTLLEIECGGSDKLTAADIGWRFDSQVPTMPTPIVAEGLVFFISDRGIATCVDAESGQQIWRERLGGEYSASPILADGKLYFADRDGRVFVVAPERSFQLLATNELDSAIMATPAAVDRFFIVRTEKSLYRIQR